jgi:hypothetical protein
LKKEGEIDIEDQEQTTEILENTTIQNPNENDQEIFS